MTPCCPGQHSAWITALPDSMQIYSTLSRTAFIFTQRSPGQHSDLLNALPDSIQIYPTLSWTAFIFTQRSPKKCSAGVIQRLLKPIFCRIERLRKIKFVCALSVAVLSLTQRCPGLHPAQLRVFLERAESMTKANNSGKVKKVKIAGGVIIALRCFLYAGRVQMWCLTNRLRTLM